MYDIGVAYYPEHWDRERWAEDIRLMKEAGISFVRLAEFAWHKMEPEEGVYDFGWLRDIVDLLSQSDLEVILCTPTATYPAWLHKKHPDIHQIASDGRVKEYGQRQDACRNHPGYRSKARAVTAALAESLGTHHRVSAWQIDNEFGNHDSVLCYCSHCEKEFRTWLKEKYQSIGDLNQAWGTTVWSQTYNDFTEISLPRDTGDNRRGRGQNPGLVLDHRRFASDSIQEFQSELVHILREKSPGRIITHNFMKDFTGLDAFAMARDLDVVSLDNYPFYELDGNTGIPSSFIGHFMHGLKNRGHWVMEQATGTGGLEIMNPNDGPGVARLWAWQSVLSGAQRICFFRWRTSRFGAEQYWHGILPHHGKPDFCYDEVQRFAGELKSVRKFLSSAESSSEVAILYDADCLWSIEHQPQAEQGFSYHDLAKRCSDAVRTLGYTPTVIPPDRDFSNFPVILLPSQHVVGGDLVERLTEFVQGGGTVILGPRSGVKDQFNAVVEDLLPGEFRSLAGVSVSAYDAAGSRAEGTVTVSGGGLASVVATGMADILQSDEGTETLLSWDSLWYAGQAAATRHSFGRGHCFYLGAVLDPADMAILLDAWRILPSRAPALPENIESYMWYHDAVPLHAYLNHNSTEVTFTLDQPGRDLLTDSPAETSLTLPAYGVALILDEN